LATFRGEANNQAGYIFQFISGPVLTAGLVTVMYLSFWSIYYFVFTLIEGFVVHCQGLLLRPVFPIGVHSADESEISSRTCFVDRFTSKSSGYFSIHLGLIRIPNFKLFCTTKSTTQIFFHALIVRSQKTPPEHDQEPRSTTWEAQVVLDLG